MNRLINAYQNVEMSPEELELFQAYRSQLHEGFDLFKKANLAITVRENELKALTVQMDIDHEKFVREREAAQKILDDVKEKTHIEKANLLILKSESNQHRRKIRYLEKQIINYQKCIPTEESSKK